MKTRYALALAAATGFALWCSARADVLFLDLNNSPKEVEAAQKAAAARGEKVVVIPTVTTDSQNEIKSARSVMNAAVKTSKSACGPDADPAACANANKAFASARENYSKTLASHELTSTQALSHELGLLKTAHTNLSSVIISGHHTDKEFWGIYATLNEEQIEKAFVDNKPLGEGVRSLYLWGCYAGTDDDFLHGWKNAFPNTALMAGFSGQAPLSIRPSSGNFLGAVMTKEQQLVAASDKAQLNSLFNGLSDVNRVNAQICVNRDLVVSKKGARTLNEDLEACGHRGPEETKFAAIYHCYLNVEAGCEDPPDVNNEQSDLRKAYDFFQETRQCDEALQSQGHPREETQQDIRRILFDKPARASFERLIGPQLGQMNQVIDRLKLPGDLHMSNLAAMKRKEYLAKVNQLERAYAQKMDEARDSSGHVTDPNVVALGYFLTQVENFSKGECVPLEWIEEDPTLHDSKCGLQAGMKSAWSDAQAEISKQH